MKICNDCGCELDDDQQLCPLCGAKVPADGGEAAPEEGALADEPLDEGGEALEPAEGEGEKAGQKRKLLFAGLGVAVVVLAAWLISGLLGSPRDQFLLQHRNLLQTMAKNEFAIWVDGAKSLADYSLDMTVTAEAEGSDDAAQAVNSALADSAVHLKLNMGETGYAMDGDIVFGGSPFLSGSLRYDGEAGTLGFYLPELSGQYYIADYAALLENLTGQESRLENAPNTAEETKAAYERMAKTYGGILQNTVKKSNVTKQSGRYPIFIINNDWKATAYVFKPTARDLEEMFLALADALEADQDLPRLVSAFDGETRAKLVSDLRENAGGTAQELADKGFTWTIRTNNKGNYQVEISWRDGDNDAWIRFERTGNGLYFGHRGVTAPSGDEPFEVYVTYYGDGAAGYHGDLYIADMMPFEFENVHPEKVSSLFVPYGDYKFSPDDYVLMTLNVAAASDGGTDHILRVNDFSSAGGQDSVTVNFHTTDRPVTLSEPDGPVEDITSYTAQEFETLGRELTQKLFGLVLNRGMSR